MKKKAKKAERLAAEKASNAAFLKKVGYKGGSTYRAPFPDYSVDDNGIKLSNTVMYQPKMAKRKANEYTGDVIIGIATMHKSNAVPVTNKKNAEEISKMRR